VYKDTFKRCFETHLFGKTTSSTTILTHLATAGASDSAFNVDIVLLISVYYYYYYYYYYYFSSDRQSDTQSVQDQPVCQICGPTA